MLQLEQERARLEHELAAARGEGEVGTASNLGADLQANAERRAEAYDNSRRERAPLSAFISYAHEDEAFKDDLEEAMAGLKLDGSIVSWTDRRIVPGGNWAEDIHEALEEANLVLLLVSSRFLNSAYCTGVELKRALERHSEGSVVVIPVILSAADWTGLLGHLQALPTDGKPISLAADRDEAYQQVVQGLRRVAADLRAG